MKNVKNVVAGCGFRISEMMVERCLCCSVAVLLHDCYAEIAEMSTAAALSLPLHMPILKQTAEDTTCLILMLMPFDDRLQ
jgi:hypothetical protein